MAKPVYPLKQVLEVKQKRVDDAEKVVQEKMKALEAEKQKLVEREKDRDKAIAHHTDKLNQLRQCLDEGTTTDKIIQMKNYMKVAKEKVKIEEKKVKDQQEQVNIASKNLQEAQNQLKLRRLEVDKLDTHRKDWHKEMLKEEEVIIGREQDEIGNIIFSTKRLRNPS